jgi:hypothetical protein
MHWRHATFQRRYLLGKLQRLSGRFGEETSVFLYREWKHVAWVLRRQSYPGTACFGALLAAIDMGADSELIWTSDVFRLRDEGSRFLRNVGNQ